MNLPLYEPVHKKILWAEEVYKDIGLNLKSIDTISSYMTLLERSARQCFRLMDEIGISRFCRECERIDGGSCCARGIEEYISPVTILINRLMGVGLPDKRYDPKGCIFLGKEGCRLLVREAICVNYICGKIEHNITPAELFPLREREGEMLSLLFFLNEEIKKALQSFGDG